MAEQVQVTTKSKTGLQRTELRPIKPVFRKTRHLVKGRAEVVNDEIYSLIRRDGKFLVDVLGMAEAVWRERPISGEEPGHIVAVNEAIALSIKKRLAAMENNIAVIAKRFGDAGISVQSTPTTHFTWNVEISSPNGAQFVEMIKKADQLYTLLYISALYGSVVDSPATIERTKQEVVEMVKKMCEKIYNGYFTRINKGATQKQDKAIDVDA